MSDCRCSVDLEKEKLEAKNKKIEDTQKKRLANYARIWRKKSDLDLESEIKQKCSGVYSRKVSWFQKEKCWSLESIRKDRIKDVFRKESTECLYRRLSQFCIRPGEPGEPFQQNEDCMLVEQIIEERAELKR